jgi:uncharacterized protein involved in outer membrane biogenesis
VKLSSKIEFVVVAIIVAIPHILLLTAKVIVNSAAVKTGIEQIASEALEMDFEIEGGIDIRF